MKQTPAPGTRLLTHSGDAVIFTLRLTVSRRGRAVLRTSLGGAAARRREIIESADNSRPVLACEWSDIPMTETEPGVYVVRIPVIEVGCFRAKTCFFPEDGGTAEWPHGDDVHIKTSPAWTVQGASVYTAFPRQFGRFCEAEKAAPEPPCAAELEKSGWTVIPPEGTFRSLIRRLDVILEAERFRIVQLLPIHPVPTTFARMGRYGSAFAGTDFLSVNPGFAEFDVSATPLDQFRELVEAVHLRGARLFIDLPANHTGWASTLQMHHPDWFRRNPDGRFVSPGAWGTIWEDLVELDYANAGLRDFMTGVFEFWCRQGVDGFRCDAGYMVPAEVWRYLVARVREQFPDTVFLLEGLGGKISVTRNLIADEGLDWAYSELFQTEDRAAFERYLPAALAMSSETGPLVHFAETHDNNRLAARSHAYATMRTALAALLSHQGCFGITNGVEWFATEKVDVHGASALRWGNADNQVGWIRRLNAIVSVHPAFAPGADVRMVQCREGNSLAVVRTPRNGAESSRLLVLINLDDRGSQPVAWPAGVFNAPGEVRDLLGGGVKTLPQAQNGVCSLRLEAGQVLCLTMSEAASGLVDDALEQPRPFTLETVRMQELKSSALRIRAELTKHRPLALDEDVERLARMLAEDPLSLISEFLPADAMPPVTECNLPDDVHRIVMVPHRHFILVRAPHPFRCVAESEDGRIRGSLMSHALMSGGYCALLSPGWRSGGSQTPGWLKVRLYAPGAPCVKVSVRLCVLPDSGPRLPVVRSAFSGMEVLRGDLVALLTNGRGAMSHVRAKWGTVRSQYDAILAANPDRNVPCDRWMLFTRCRTWVVNQGYSSEVDSSCLKSFECVAGSGTASWCFRVPVGTGRSVDLTLRLVLHRDENRVTLSVLRARCGEDGELLDDEAAVQVVLRPDVESRSFHTKTKAFAGPEREWPSCVSQLPGGFTFRPQGLPGLAMRVSNGAFVVEPEWHYMVAHPVDAQRGQDGCSDLYSPGWFTARLEGGEKTELDAECIGGDEPVSGTIRGSGGIGEVDAKPVSVRKALSRALRDYVVRRDEFMTVIAGYPWFLDWGRDTFIALRGMIADGMEEAALGIVRKFGEFESGGTLPNMINGKDASNRDTSDAQLWYVVAVNDLAVKIGPENVLGAACGKRTVRDVVLSIAEGYRRGTANGIRMDEASGLVYSPSHFTWMDTNFPAGTPRAGYPVEIQALWIAALEILSGIDKDGPWQEIGDRARASLAEYFWRKDKGFLSDCLHADVFKPASHAVADDHLRCNQLFAVTLGAISDKAMCRSMLRMTEKLLVPGGIRTLSCDAVDYLLPIYGNGGGLNDPSMPYWGHYEGNEDTRRKPAYHNGTSWTWPFPSYAEALLRVYGASAKASARAMIGSAAALMERDCAGQLPEIMDGDAPHEGRGCDAQAWGVSEFLRVAILLGM